MANSYLKITIIIGILMAFVLGLSIVVDNSIVTVYLDGENVSTSVLSAPFIHDTDEISKEINTYVYIELNENFNSNVTDIKRGIEEIITSHGIDQTRIILDSPYGENQLPIIFVVCGTSMIPTLENNQKILVLQTKNIQVGDIVVSNDSNYGIIVKRVSEIDGDQAFLTSDNKNVEIVYIDGIPYTQQGIRTWNNISNIIGVVKGY